jgi:hypothetical protein
MNKTFDCNGSYYTGNVHDIITENKPQAIPSNTLNLPQNIPTENIQKLQKAYDFFTSKEGNILIFVMISTIVIFIMNG